MKLFAKFLLVGFVGIAVLSPFGMHVSAIGSDMAGHDSNIGNCIAAVTQGVDCPIEVGSMGFAAFHLDAFRVFSTATISENLFYAISLAFLLLVAVSSSFVGSASLNLVYVFCRQKWHRYF